MGCKLEEVMGKAEGLETESIDEETEGVTMYDER